MIEHDEIMKMLPLPLHTPTTQQWADMNNTTLTISQLTIHLCIHLGFCDILLCMNLCINPRAHTHTHTHTLNTLCHIPIYQSVPNKHKNR